MDETLTMGITLPRELRDRVDEVSTKESISVAEVVRRSAVLELTAQNVGEVPAPAPLPGTTQDAPAPPKKAAVAIPGDPALGPPQREQHCRGATCASPIAPRVVTAPCVVWAISQSAAGSGYDDPADGQEVGIVSAFFIPPRVPFK